MQEILVVFIVASAFGYLGVRLYKSLFSKKSNCEVNCGCDTPSVAPIFEQLKNKK